MRREENTKGRHVCLATVSVQVEEVVESDVLVAEEQEKMSEVRVQLIEGRRVCLSQEYRAGPTTAPQRLTNLLSLVG